MKTCAPQGRPGNLPPETSTFVGRESELRAAARAFGTTRLVTLTGPGGVGKTRIALRAAERLGSRLAQGAWFVELSPVLDPALVPQAVTNALGPVDQTSRPLLDVLVEYLRERELLLVLDTCEHLAEACGELAVRLLDAAPGLRVLATSRQPLGVPAERLIAVGPMETGRDGDAVTLLADRAWPEGTTDEGSPVSVPAGELARICTLLDGIPLAIELAAARLRTTPVEELARRLAEPMSALSPAEAPATGNRHAGLRTSIGWSHEWCTPRERLLWARLSVFPGSFESAAVDYVCTGEPFFGFDLHAELNSLVAKSIVLQEGKAGGGYGAHRYRLLDTIREYGAEWLERLGGTRQLRRKHRDYYRHLALTFCDAWVGPHQVEWTARMYAELPNLRLAMSECVESSVEMALEMAGDLVAFGVCCGHAREVRGWTEAALAADPACRGPRARALWSCAYATLAQGELRTCITLAEQAHELAVEQQDEAAETGALYAYASAKTVLGETDQVVPLFDEVHEKAERLGLAWIGVMSLATRAWAHVVRGEPDQARDTVARLKVLARASGELWAGGFGEFILGNLSIAQGRFGPALGSLRVALEAKRRLADPFGMALALDALAVAACGDGRPELAARACGVTDRLWDGLGTPHLGAPGLTEARRACEEKARAELGAEAYGVHYLRGYTERSATVGVDYILRLLPGPPAGSGFEA
ncbi:hypothetical protein H9Y04_35945 [Streptomyces sp. TRM66268-LWL]|uniref:LuxR family transcriptional regulator n=1 Tax=Streptomyces polyasparticus TaxID=2767826 RepID=A0ABR7SUI6_9ACTN|nr:AAA family ATPase [Streptomyces polyasparticus]MBC9717938.1 hypothetical protein [Streptomyces polyasparticus]